LAIRSIQAPLQIQGAVGLFNEIEVRFLSDDALTNKTLYFNPSLWEQIDSSPIVSSTPTEGFYLDYPVSTGTYEMNLLSDASYQNYRAFLEVVSNKEFVITFWHLHTIDINGPMGVNTVNNTLRFTSESVATSNIYAPASKFLRFQVVDSDLNVGYAHIPSVANWFCDLEAGDDYNFSVNGRGTSGFTAAGNLRVEGTLPFSSFLSNEYYVMLYRDSGADPTDNFVDDLRIKYAEVTSVSEQVGDLDHTVFVNITALKSDGTFAFEIDPSAFDLATYRLAFVYRDGTEWKACRTEPFGLDDGDGREVAVPEYSCRLCEYHGTTYDACCFDNISACERVQICQTIDKGSYGLAAQQAGHGGTFDQNLKAITVYYADSPTQLAPDAGSIIDDVEVTDFGSTYEVCGVFRVPEEFAGDFLYVIFRYEYEIPNTGGSVDYVYQATTLNVTGESSGIDNFALFDSEGGESIPADFVCDDEETLRLEFDNNTGEDLRVIAVLQTDDEQNNFGDTCMTGLDTPLILSYSDSVSNGDSGFIEFNLEEFVSGVEYCVKLLTRRSINRTCICDNEFDSLSFNFFIRECVEFQGDYSETIFFFDIPALAGNIDFISIKIYDDERGRLLDQLSTSSESGLMNFVNPFGGNREHRHVVFIKTLDGCSYNYTFVRRYNRQEPRENGECYDFPNPVYYRSVELCDNTGGFPTVPCENFPSIEPSECVAGQLFSERGGTFASGISTDDLTTTTDGIVFTPYTEGDLVDAPITFRRIVTYTDGCDADTVYQYVDCLNDGDICDNSPEIALSHTDEELSFGVSGLITSAYVLDWQCSLDGGLTFSPCGSSPLDTTGVDEVMFMLTVTYLDGCPEDVLYDVWERGECEYEGYALSCVESNGNVTPTFTDGGETLTTDTKEYSIDGGQTWLEWTGGPIAGDLVLFRWTIQTDGCEKECLFTACADDCCPECETGDCLENYCTGICDPEDDPCDDQDSGEAGSIDVCE
jgi:hypothetical protein